MSFKKQHTKKIAFTALMSSLAVCMSLFTLPFLFGVNIHLFQVAILIAAAGGGPISGIITGLFGGIYMASMRGDVTIIIGNGLIGLFAGFLIRKFRPMIAGPLSWFLIQMPWIYIIDTYFYRFPSVVVETILTVLTVEILISSLIVDVLMFRFGFKQWVLKKLDIEVSS